MTIQILLVEDQPRIAEIVQFALASEGFQTTWRTLTAEAESELSAKAHDLVVLDIGSPDGSGLELLKRLWRGSRPRSSARSSTPFFAFFNCTKFARFPHQTANQGD